MNKYEEAFTAMATFVNLQGCIDSRKVYVLKQIETISELVDKSTPKKVVNWLRDKSMACCPYCDSAGYSREKHNHCYYCGQALDWEETK